MAWTEVGFPVVERSEFWPTRLESKNMCIVKLDSPRASLYLTALALVLALAAYSFPQDDYPGIVRVVRLLFYITLLALLVALAVWGLATRRKRKQEETVVVSGAASLHLRGGSHAVGVVIHSLWRARFSAHEWLHEMFPKLRGVLLSLHHEGEIPPGRYFCELITPDGERHATVMEVTGGGNVLSRVFPSDFEEASEPPLDPGTYQLRWLTEDGIAKRELATVDFRLPDDLKQP